MAISTMFFGTDSPERKQLNCRRTGGRFYRAVIGGIYRPDGSTHRA
jgi:hypothetical protein